MRPARMGKVEEPERAIRRMSEWRRAKWRTSRMMMTEKDLEKNLEKEPEEEEDNNNETEEENCNELEEENG